MYDVDPPKNVTALEWKHATNISVGVFTDRVMQVAVVEDKGVFLLIDTDDEDPHSSALQWYFLEGRNV